MSDLTKLKKLTLVFENVESYDIEPKYIQFMYFGGIQNEIGYDESDHTIDENRYCNYVHLMLDYDKLNQIGSTQSFSGDIDNDPMGLADRIKEYNDITWIDIVKENPDGKITTQSLEMPYQDYEDEHPDDPDVNDPENLLQHAKVYGKKPHRVLDIEIKPR